jgi:hypothetical protein
MKLRIDLFIDNLDDTEIVKALDFFKYCFRVSHKTSYTYINEAGDIIGECEIVETEES